MVDLEKIGLGGGCHWCTEAVFQQLKGVAQVEQGYIASLAPYDSLSEGIIVHFDPQQISLAILFEVHVHTHRSTKNHSFRAKYRSAVYTFSEEQVYAFAKALPSLQQAFSEPIITKTLPFEAFKASPVHITDYYRKHPEAPFCERYIIPKLDFIKGHYMPYIN